MQNYKSQNNTEHSVESILDEYLYITQQKLNLSPSLSAKHITKAMEPMSEMLESSSLQERREYNITLIAWAEWWAASIKMTQYIPQIRGLGAMLEMLQRPFGIDTPQDWVNKRVIEINASNIQWQENDLAMPIYNSLPRFEPAHQAKYDELDCVEMNGLAG